MNLLKHFQGMLEGPIAERHFPGFKISLWVKTGHRDKFDPKRHGKIAREAAEQAFEKAPGTVPNPTLVPLDGDEHANGAHVFAHITLKGPHRGEPTSEGHR